MTKEVTILSYGGGVDSTAILPLMFREIVPKADVVLMADPGAEFPQTYETFKTTRAECAKHNIPVKMVL
jgi:3'-phosphoadenosine 5'-phosphosulfate sulfotransferase (PAPS reductase)/FAD synthetase